MTMKKSKPKPETKKEDTFCVKCGLKNCPKIEICKRVRLEK